MVRNKLAAAIAALGALQAGVAGALGMGDFSLQSALNQPLEAEIRLMNASDLDNTQVRITLANTEQFANAGVSRDYFLTNFKFTVEMDGKGGGIIKVSTREAVIEPYLNFLVEARWPNGRLLREYTVLLDLPVFSEVQNKPVTMQGNMASADSPAVAPASQIKASAPTYRSSRQTLAEGELVSGEKYRVRADDTLWDIAAKSRPSSNVSVQQNMLGIQRLNPNAFSNGNINRLKAGSVLRLPNASEVADISSRQAIGDVAEQNRAWRSGDNTSREVTTAQLDATDSSSASDDRHTEQARLSIASGGASDQSAIGDGEGSGVGSMALQNELDLAQESLDKAGRSNDELQSRLQDMESKLATLQRLIELKDDQLASFQSGAAEQNQAVEVAQEPTISEVAAMDEVVGSPAEIEEETTEAATKPKPVLTEPESEPELLDQLLGNPLYAGGAGLLLLAVIVLFMRRRKAAEEQQAAAEFDFEEIEDASLAEATFDETEFDLGEPGLDLEPESEPEEQEVDQMVAELEQQIAADNAEEEALAELQEPEADTVIQAETEDAIAEADIYIAYGRYQQAVDLLSSAISQEPERSDLQLKLLEVYIETRDKPGFQQQYPILRELGDEAATVQVKEILSSVEGVADWLDDLPSDSNDTDLSAVDMDAELIEGVSDSAQDDLEIDLDLDELGSTQETEAISLDALELDGLEIDGSDFDPEEEIDLDFDTELDVGGEDISLNKTMQFDAVTADAAEVDLSLDDDLEIELDKADESIELDEELVTEAGFDLDLDGDLELDIDSLEDSELSELEAEFGETEVSGETINSGLDLGEVDLELEPSPEFSLEGVENVAAAAVPAAIGEESFDAADTDSATDDFDFLADTDEVATKLDLARAYIDMGDTDGAKDILDEVMQEGSDQQKQEASELLERAE
jgi:pilus assembly protein FimV